MVESTIGRYSLEETPLRVAMINDVPVGYLVHISKQVAAGIFFFFSRSCGDHQNAYITLIARSDKRKCMLIT